jgi:hypothetical protein
MHVAAANAAGFDRDEHFCRTRLRDRRLFAGEVFVFFENQGFHWIISGSSPSA